MPIGTGLALGLGLAGSLGGAAVSGITSAKAADTQADAANNAANLQYKLGTQGLDFQKQEWNTQQQNIAPWLQAGSGAVGRLSSLLQPGGELTQGWNQHFQAPTNVTEQNDPGYQFRLSQGLDALQNSAAARGGLLSGGTAKAINNYAQSDASNEYSNVYGRALGEYQQNYNQFQNNQSNLFNRNAAVAGMGQTAAGQLGQFGAAAAGNIGNILGRTGEQVGQNYNNAGAATASGQVGIGNALSSGLSSIGNYAMLSSLLNNSSYGGGAGASSFGM